MQLFFCHGGIVLFSRLLTCNISLYFSYEESAKYIENFKSLHYKSATLLKQKTQNDDFAKAEDFLTSIKGVNKTDALRLLSTFGNLEQIILADGEDLKKCSGLGPRKISSILNTFNRPFKK